MIFLSWVHSPCCGAVQKMDSGTTDIMGRNLHSLGTMHQLLIIVNNIIKLRR